MPRSGLVFIILVLGLLVARPVRAITLEQVVALEKAGLTETVILALIDRDRTVFAIEPEQIVALQRDGLSERIILAMLKSGRDQGDQVARADAASNAAWIAAALATEPVSVSVGHGPDRPNTPHIDGFYSGAPGVAAGFIAPFYAPMFRSRNPSIGSRRGNPPPSTQPRPSEARALCYAQISTQYAQRQGQFITECPP